MESQHKVLDRLGQSMGGVQLTLGASVDKFKKVGAAGGAVCSTSERGLRGCGLPRNTCMLQRGGAAGVGHSTRLQAAWLFELGARLRLQAVAWPSFSCPLLLARISQVMNEPHGRRMVYMAGGAALLLFLVYLWFWR